MSHVPLRHVIGGYIGGGWGKETPDREHTVPASVIRGTDLDTVQSGAIDRVPFRWHKASNARSRSLEAGDIVFEVSGGSKDQPVGRSLLLDDARLAKFQGAVIPASFCKRITPNQTRIHPRFLLAHLQLAWADRRIVQWQVQSTGISNFNFEAFLDDFVIELPPLPIQRRIAGILSAYDELIENSQRRIKILESMARALYREWFVHFRFPGHESVSRVASPLGEIPQGWEVRKLESLMTGHIGGGWGKDVPDDDHTEPAWVIRGTDIPDARCAQVSGVPHRFHTTSNLRSRRLLQSDILFEVSGGSKGQPVGRTLLLTPQLMSAFDGDVICASFCKRITPDASSYGSELLYLSFLEGYESGEIEQFQVQSTGISNFKWTEYIAKTNRVVPPEPLRSTFRAHVVQFFAEVATLGLQIQNLRRTRDLLLPRLLSGQIDVEALSDDSEESSSHAQPQERVHESIYPSAMVVDTPVQTGKQQVQKAPVLDELTLDDILIAMRRAFSEGGPQEREDAIREVAYRLGFQRAGARIREAIADAFMKAVRRGMLIKDADIYSLAFRSYAECTRESLKDDFESAMGRGWISREDATRAFARWSGFGRVGDVINEHARSVINGLIREGRIETDGQDLIRRVKSDNRKN